MQEILIEFVNNLGYFGLALLIFIENVFPPIPSEAILLFGGFMTTKTEMATVPLIIAATIGSLLGATILYIVGSALGKQRLKAILDGRVGRILHLKSDSVESADKWFGKYGGKAVLICRCIPIVRSLISIPAGMAKMRFIPFILLTALGSTVWNTVLVLLGRFMGDAWEKCLDYFGIYTLIAAIVIVIVLVIAFITYKRKSKQN